MGVTIEHNFNVYFNLLQQMKQHFFIKGLF
jgi:hypothetical protein